jgi:hypothetical protein
VVHKCLCVSVYERESARERDFVCVSQEGGSVCPPTDSVCEP